MLRRLNPLRILGNRVSVPVRGYVETNQAKHVHDRRHVSVPVRGYVETMDNEMKLDKMFVSVPARGYVETERSDFMFNVRMGFRPREGVC